MQDGFIKVAAIAPRVRVADVAFNVCACDEALHKAKEHGAKLVVLPELAITGATCADLFWQDSLIAAAEKGISALAAATADVDALVLVGAPVALGSSLYSCAIAIAHGAVIGIVPKAHIDANGVAQDLANARHFVPAFVGDPITMNYAGFSDVFFGTKQLFVCSSFPELAVAVELGADLSAPVNPATAHVALGATVVAGLGARYELVGASRGRRRLVNSHSKRLTCAYVCSNAAGESTGDGVCAGHCLIAENGKTLAESVPFGDGVAITEVDVAALLAERRRARACVDPVFGYHVTTFDLQLESTELTRTIDPTPFLPSSDDSEAAATCEGILTAQAAGLAARLRHTGSARVVLGVSGGLDSTLALLVCARAFVAMERSNSDIVAVSMPGFGTTDRTHDNAAALVEALGATLHTVPIAASVRQHFADIGHSEDIHNAAYENAQARERTQILMDMANDLGALVVGTGDLSELALGWATYNGDHMSMYAVNADVSKTLARRLVRHAAETTLSAELTRVLEDVLATPISPELLPADADGSIAQRTEDLVGPYELHDFYLYQVLRHGFAPRKVFRLACAAWGSSYGDATILHWLRVFYQRFFSQQFKRSCMPDGPAIGTVGLSPRGGLSMPSDAVSSLWMAELDLLRTDHTRQAG